ncbi:MAG: sortase B protein-sorting domain-containing protein [Bacteroidota bacterium]
MHLGTGIIFGVSGLYLLYRCFS